MKRLASFLIAASLILAVLGWIWAEPLWCRLGLTGALAGLVLSGVKWPARRRKAAPEYEYGTFSAASASCPPLPDDPQAVS
jgi:hypothetical protein